MNTCDYEYERQMKQEQPSCQFPYEKKSYKKWKEKEEKVKKIADECRESIKELDNEKSS